MPCLPLAFVMCVLALFSSAGVGHADWSIKDMNRQIDQTAFLVNDDCSATLIDAKEGYLLTASHCITDQFKIVDREKIKDDGSVKTEKVKVSKPGTVSQIIFSNDEEVQKTSFAFKVVAYDEKHSNLDLALIQTLGPLPNKMQAPIACDMPERGDTVYVVGNILGTLYASLSKGNIASVNRNYRMIGVDEKGGLFHHTAATGGGSSGGAIYNTSGEMIGVNVQGKQEPAPIGLAVPLRDIKSFLKDHELERLIARCEDKK